MGDVGLPETIAAGVASARTATLDTLDTVAIARQTGRGSDGAPTYAAAVNWRALVSRKPARFFTQQGEGIAAAWTVTIPEPCLFGPGDKVTHDGETRIVVEARGVVNPDTGLWYAGTVFCS